LLTASSSDWWQFCGLECRFAKSEGNTVGDEHSALHPDLKCDRNALRGRIGGYSRGVIGPSGTNPLLGGYVPYSTFLPAVAFCAWYCGIGPSILRVVVALLAAQYWFIPPIHSLRIVGTAQMIGILAFSSVSGVLVAMGEVRRRRELALLASHGKLEEAVKERTGELDQTNQNLRELSARLMQLQDEERRRLARELHDSVGQTLAALGMNLAAMATDIERLTKTVNTVNDSAALVRELSQEVRTISRLLHPPLLDEAGLASALRWYTEGFA
jgi:signal transduction histidine kinase